MGKPRTTPVQDSYPCAVCGRVLANAGGWGRHMQGHADAEANFWKNVVQDDETGCWEWQASKIHKGYPRFTVCHKHILAYRFAYELLEGAVPEGLELDHLCRNSGCVNPGHLEPVTHMENMRRAKEVLVANGSPCPACAFVAAIPAALSSHVRHKHPAIHRPKTYQHNGKSRLLPGVWREA